jgi:hypothetical protein
MGCGVDQANDPRLTRVFILHDSDSNAHGHPHHLGGGITQWTSTSPLLSVMCPVAIVLLVRNLEATALLLRLCGIGGGSQ